MSIPSINLFERALLSAKDIAMAKAIFDPNTLLEHVDPTVAEQAQLAADAFGSERKEY